ncbi:MULTISPECIES: hypothetical protein [unclassified Paenibacillus]|uniref:hypothetical protein n=1 Tax=unclassified Paenibacillus TaxID=185978 RepID=UPI000CFBB59E|nr:MULTISPECIES: hypothetical protein [unclassified Paenibacillus]PRA07903.1 hypothetical protein CQ043_11210 [Paenibacillus sp. MYb63]PRA48020.1 hypothetical protein CQ061_15620 [Paenibacillus sp. MYb67]QZN74574.1 hypothetical protein K5K90_24770 [Paenibacillus sp. DR312]
MSGFKEKFRSFSKLCTEDYLIRYANKGLYKRSLKELDNGVSVTYKWNESSVSCQLSDGTQCTLENTLDHWNCSCPSEHICKHVLIAILYDQRELSLEDSMSADENHVLDKDSGISDNDSLDASKDVSVTESVSNSASNRDDSNVVSHSPSLEMESRFHWMTESDLSVLIKPYSASMLEEVVFRLRYPEEVKIIVDSLLTVQLTSQDMEVSFTEEASLAKALCKLPQTAGKMAKLEALLRYRSLKGLDDTDALSGRVYEAKFSLQTVQECRMMLAGLLKTGLARLPQSYMAQLETLAIAAHSGNLPDIERNLRGIQGELQLFFNRHIRFSMQSMLDRISKLYLALRVLEEEKVSVIQQSQLIGSFRSKYFTVPSLHLYGLGADAWETRSGFRGITYYFYCFDDEEIYTYSDVRAVYYDDQEFSYTEHYGAFTPWLPNLTFRQFVGEEVQFHSVKVNEERRISSGEGAKLAILPRTGVETLNLGKTMQDVNSVLQEESRSFDLFAAPKERLAVIKVARIVDHNFVKQTQELVLTVENTEGERLALTLPYSSDWQAMIQRLESGYGSQSLEYFYAFVRVEPKRISPISFLKGQTVLSLKLDIGNGRMGRLGRI